MNASLRYRPLRSLSLREKGLNDQAVCLSRDYQSITDCSSLAEVDIPNRKLMGQSWQV